MTTTGIRLALTTARSALRTQAGQIAVGGNNVASQSIEAAKALEL
jgi:hypothetical protein